MSEDAVSVILIREKEVGQCPIYFFIEGPSRSRNPISENWESCPRRGGGVKKTQKIFPSALHSGLDWFSLEACALSTKLGRKVNEMGKKLSEFEFSFEARKELKAQLFVIFLAYMVVVSITPYRTWVVFTDGSSNDRGSGAEWYDEKKRVCGNKIKEEIEE